MYNLNVNPKYDVIVIDLFSLCAVFPAFIERINGLLAPGSRGAFFLESDGWSVWTESTDELLYFKLQKK